MAKVKYEIDGIVIPEDDGTFTAESYVLFPDGDLIEKSVKGLATREYAEIVLDGLISEAEKVIRSIGGVSAEEARNIMN